MKFVNWLNGLSRQDYVIFTTISATVAFYIGARIAMLL